MLALNRRSNWVSSDVRQQLKIERAGFLMANPWIPYSGLAPGEIKIFPRGWG